MISDKNVKRILGKEVLIYPLFPENIEGASIFLTASHLAWSLKDKTPSISDDWISIPAGDSIIIMTNESVALSLKYSGICFPRVPNTTHGLITCTTYIKPGWVGKLAVVICNPTNINQKIHVNDSVCVLTIERKGAQFTIQMLTNLGISVSPKEEGEISNGAFSDFQNMKYELGKSDNYKKFKEKNKTFWTEPINILIAIVTICFIPLLALTIKSLIQGNSVVTELFVAVVAALFVLIEIKLK